MDSDKLQNSVFSPPVIPQGQVVCMQITPLA